MNVPSTSAPNTSAPGLTLLVIGILTFLSSIGMAVRCYYVVNDPAFVEDYKRQMEDMPEGQRKIVSQWGDPAKFATNALYVMIIFSAVGVVLSGAMVFGGIGLMKGSKGLGLLGGTAALIPSWCCVLGFPAGVWAIVVAMRLGKVTSPPHDPSKVESHV